MMYFHRLTVTALLGIVAASAVTASEPPVPAADLILRHGKIVTVDPDFHVVEAMAVRGDRILAVGTSAKVLALAGPNTRQIDLGGKTVLPGLIDSHLHIVSAAMYEFDHDVPAMETIADVLRFFRQRAAAARPGQWIDLRQVFITRLRERRYPTRAELDEAAPHNPVAFRTGPDAVLNSMALKLCGIDKALRITDGQPGRIEHDEATGEPTGVLRQCERLLKYHTAEKTATLPEQVLRVKKLLAAYNEVGLTSVTDRDTTDAEIEVLRALRDGAGLTCRVYLTYAMDAQMPMEKIEARLDGALRNPLSRRNHMLWLHGVKIYLDGGMLTGSAYMLKPWGVSKIYSITDPQYRGLLFVQPEQLYRVARATLSRGLQLAAHCQGDGAVTAMVDACQRVDREFPVAPLRPCIAHGSFMTLSAIERMRRTGIANDVQPAWLYLDGATLRAQFGDERLTYFHPYKTLFQYGVLVGGGSDHMQKIGRGRGINPYDPFLGMSVMLLRQPRWTDRPLHTEQCLSREEALRLYTIRNAALTFEEKEKGSLEPGKLADFIVLDRDYLTCPVKEVENIQVLQTYLSGKAVFDRSKRPGSAP
jgi:hypothetical protein